MSEEINPLFHEISRKKVIFARVFTAITAILVILAIIFCFIQASKNRSLYLCVVNIILSSIVTTVLAWWYHNGVLQANTYYFLIFVGVCLIFQSIVIDIFVWHRIPMSSETNAIVNPHTLAPANHSTTVKPLSVHSWVVSTWCNSNSIKLCEN